jgi:hypothetical protein
MSLFIRFRKTLNELTDRLAFFPFPRSVLVVVYFYFFQKKGGGRCMSNGSFSSLIFFLMYYIHNLGLDFICAWRVY